MRLALCSMILGTKDGIRLIHRMMRLAYGTGRNKFI
jgi:hypothetical protein